MYNSHVVAERGALSVAVAHTLPQTLEPRASPTSSAAIERRKERAWLLRLSHHPMLNRSRVMAVANREGKAGPPELRI